MGCHGPEAAAAARCRAPIVIGCVLASAVPHAGSAACCSPEAEVQQRILYSLPSSGVRYSKRLCVRNRSL